MKSWVRAYSFWLLLFLMGLISAAQAAIPTPGRTVLVNLYAQSNGASWINSTGWMGAARPAAFAAFFPDPELKPVFERWEKDLLAILGEVREAK